MTTKQFIALIMLIVVPSLYAGCKNTHLVQKRRSPQLYASVQTVATTDHPLIIEWSSADRGALESQMKKGGIAVEVRDGEILVLEKCVLPAQYTYIGFTRKLETQVLSTERELDANFAFGATKLGGALRRFGKLYVSMSLVGRFELNDTNLTDALSDATCADATHIVNAASLGAFRFYSGQGKSAALGATADTVAQSDAIWNGSSEFTTQDGDFDACENAASGDKGAPEGCSALVRLELQALDAKPTSPQTPFYHIGQVEFLDTSHARAFAQRSQTPVGWQRGPYPKALCDKLGELKTHPLFSPLLEFCHMHRSNRGTVLTDSSKQKTVSNWYLFELPADNCFSATFANYDTIMSAARKLPTSQAKTVERLTNTIIAVLHWHNLHGDSATGHHSETLRLLEPLRAHLDQPLLIDDDEKWWAAHLLTTAAMDDYSHELAKEWPFRFATKWHLYTATSQNAPDNERILLSLLDKLPSCDPFRVDVLELLNNIYYQTEDWDALLKGEIQLARTCQIHGNWSAPGSGVYSEAKSAGLTQDAEKYIKDDRWSLADFLWDTALDYFAHEDYLGARKNLYRIIEETPDTPVAPLAHRTLIDIERVMGNRSAAFDLKMNEPRWTAQSQWAKNMRQAAQCLDDDGFSRLVDIAGNMHPEDELISRESMVLVGRSLPQWALLTTVGSVLRSCLPVVPDTRLQSVSILRDADSGALTISSQPASKAMRQCLELNLQAEWNAQQFGADVTVNLNREPLWYLDWTTGWSKINRFKIACDAGEIEGCYQLGIVYTEDPDNQAHSKAQAKIYFQQSCSAGHAEACNALRRL